MANTLDTLGHCAERARRTFPDRATARLARDTALYLAHTEERASLRALAGAAGRHPSTVLRAVRRVEQRREDPLFDGLIGERLEARESDAPAGGGGAGAPGSGGAGPGGASGGGAGGRPEAAAPRPSETAVRRAARSALRRLNEPGAFLLLAPASGRGGIFCPTNGHRKPIAMLGAGMAAEFARRDWIAMAERGRASLRYRITEPGRAALRRILAEEVEARAAEGFAEAQAPFRAQHALPGARRQADPDGGAPGAIRVNLGESPLGWLARRKGRDGRPFLAPEEVEAGERLRDEFEAAQMGPRVAQDWAAFLTPSDRGTGARGMPEPAAGPAGARARVTAALSALGPGLSDVALRVCCFLEGLEACEKRMGWSARSGKVVLKLALQRLAQHYGLDRPGGGGA